MSKDSFTSPDIDVLIVCALALEREGLLAVVRHRHIPIIPYVHDSRLGVKGEGFRLGNLNVLVIECGVGGYDSTYTTTIITLRLVNLKLTLVSGVCGGIPKHKDEETFIGDIIVATDVVLLDFGRHCPGRFETRGQSPTTSRYSPALADMLRQIQSGPANRELNRMWNSQFENGLPCTFSRAKDNLYDPQYVHIHRNQHCQVCDPSTNLQCEDVRTTSCRDAGCDPRFLLKRTLPTVPQIAFGPIGCSNAVIKDAEYRDSSHQRHGIIALEMEGYGVLTAFQGTIVVKSVCDYADSHKEKQFQNVTAQYAGAVSLIILEIFQKLQPSFFADQAPMQKSLSLTRQSSTRGRSYRHRFE